MTQVLLIDGETIASAQAEAILRRFGTGASACRVYGHPERLSGWAAHDWVRTSHVARGRSGTSFAIAVDALTLAHGRRARSFVLIGLTGDFSWMVSHLRAQGCEVSVIAADDVAEAAAPQPAPGTRTARASSRLRVAETVGSVTRLVRIDTNASAATVAAPPFPAKADPRTDRAAPPPDSPPPGNGGSDHAVRLKA